MIKILFLPKYDRVGASSRYRIYQYLKYFSNNGIEFKVIPLLDRRYFEIDNKAILLIYCIYRYFLRYWLVFSLKKYEIIYIEKEVFPFLPPIFNRIFLKFGNKYILDYDDAIFHDYDLHPNKVVRKFAGKKIPNLMKQADFIICGSPYLTKYALQFNNKVMEIPTSIDVNNYTLDVIAGKGSDIFTIGWIGSKSTSKYIVEILPSITEFYSKHRCKVKLVGFYLSSNMDIPEFIEIVPWNSCREKKDLCSIDVGIMPLDDSPWSQGKCGFKLIQYMACAKPTISTPLEANVKIDHENGNLFASSTEDWLNCFEKIYLNREHFKEIGNKNRRTVEKYYTVQQNTELYIKVFSKVISPDS